MPQAVACATKPQIAASLIAAALDAGTPCAWVLADALDGADSRIRRLLEARGQPYVLATRSNHHLRFLTANGVVQTDPATLADALPAAAWAPHAAGEGAKGIRLYDWARVALPWITDAGFERWVLIRRRRRDADARAYYLVFPPAGTGLAELAGAAGLRWTIEECFERAKEELGLDHCEARSWHGWHQHMTLCMAAGAFLAWSACRPRHQQHAAHSASFHSREKGAPSNPGIKHLRRFDHDNQYHLLIGPHAPLPPDWRLRLHRFAPRRRTAGPRRSGAHPR